MLISRNDRITTKTTDATQQHLVLSLNGKEVHPSPSSSRLHQTGRNTHDKLVYSENTTHLPARDGPSSCSFRKVAVMSPSAPPDKNATPEHSPNHTLKTKTTKNRNAYHAYSSRHESHSRHSKTKTRKHKNYSTTKTRVECIRTYKTRINIYKNKYGRRY